MKKNKRDNMKNSRTVEEMLKNKPDHGSRYRSPTTDKSTDEQTQQGESRTDRLVRYFEENLWQWERLDKGPNNTPAYVITFDRGLGGARSAWIHVDGRICFSPRQNFAIHEIVEVMAKHDTLFFQESDQCRTKRQEPCQPDASLDKNALKLVCDSLERLACEADREDWGYKDPEPEKAKVYRNAIDVLKGFQNE